MSRYEKINYDELELLSANGGTDAGAAASITHGNFCKSCDTLWKITKKISKQVSENVTKKFNCNGYVPVNPPEELHPWEP